MNRNSLSRHGAAFSLLELLVTVAIMVLLMTLVVPAFTSMNRASGVSNGGTLVIDELNFSRQTALAQNRIVETRFYKLKGTTGSGLAFRAFRSMLYDETGTTCKPLSAVRDLPAGVIISTDAKFSTLLSDSNPYPSGNLTEDLPKAPGTTYKAVRFQPSGGTPLKAMTTGSDSWFLSLVNETDRAQSDTPAANFFTVQIDPLNGRLKVFRP